MIDSELTVRGAVEAVHGGELTAVELTTAALKHFSALNGRLNIFVSLAGPEVLERAEQVDRRTREGLRLPLAGIPLAVGDDFFYSDMPSALGSQAFMGFYPPFSAAAVESLVGAGAVVVGKTACGDMGTEFFDPSAAAGPAVNPGDGKTPARSAGAAAAAAWKCLLALESDSGGAMRQGASRCGVFCLRPTPGRISRYGMALAGSSFGRPGFVTASVSAIGPVLQEVQGYDERDLQTAACAKRSGDYRVDLEEGKITIGFIDGSDYSPGDEASAPVADLRDVLAGAGFRLVDCRLEHLGAGLRAYQAIAHAEASSNLARYDGIRFGKAAEAGNLEELYGKTRRLTLGCEARRRSVFGTFLLSGENYRRYYRQALKVWALVKEEFRRTLESCDLLLLPAVKSPGPLRLEGVPYPAVYEEDLFTAPVSLAGLPALVLPAGQSGSAPYGMQLVGRPFSEELLLSVAERLFPEAGLSGSETARGEVG